MTDVREHHCEHRCYHFVMITTTTKFIRLENSPETSTIIGWLTSQQRLAYNQAVNVLNRVPHIPKRAKKGSRYGLNRAGSATPGPTTQVLGTKRPAGTDGSASQETGSAEGVQIHRM